jgi:hypothetical protein
MKISLPDPQFFNFKDCVIAGDECVLVTPKMMGVEWTEDNKYFRSSIWRKSDMHPISLGFRKFMNCGEKPSFEPFPENDKLTAITKIDGSCLLVSKYKGELIIRTRGTVDATKLDNGHEIYHLVLKYPKAFDNVYLNSENCTLLFEWTTPSNRIVLNETAEPTLWLIGLVIHENKINNEFYQYDSQSDLDYIAKELEVERPATLIFSVKEDIEKLKTVIEPLKDIEGVVIYDESGQVLKKIKTLRYLELHRVFTGVKSVDHLFDIFVEYGEPKREEFEKQLATNFDWELVTTLKPLMDELYLRTKRIATRMTWILLYLQNPDFVKLDRKEKAKKILQFFPDCSGIAFAILDNKDLSPKKLWETLNN